jgi:hypothetical protein
MNVRAGGYCGIPSSAYQLARGVLPALHIIVSILPCRVAMGVLTLGCGVGDGVGGMGSKDSRNWIGGRGMGSTEKLKY